MVKRRKVLFGIGSVAAGGAAATATGAFTSAKAERGVEIGVVRDDEALLELNLDHESLENTQYATIGEDGELRLHFDEESGGQGDGLNPNSVYTFDNVFQIMNQGTEDGLQINIDKSNLENPDRINFYALFTNGSLIGSRDSDWTGQIDAGHGINIGVRVDVPSDTLNENWEGGYIVIEANQTNHQNVE